MLTFRPIVAELTPDELADILARLEAVCAQAQELQQQIKRAMADAARRDYPYPELPDRRRTTGKRR